MEEKTFFERKGVKVTNARFVVDGQTFAISNITSVKPLEEPPKRLGGVLLLLCGFITLTQNAFFGVPVIALVSYYLYKQKPTYHVMLRTSGGENKALTTHQRDDLNKVVEALNEAIVHRG